MVLSIGQINAHFCASLILRQLVLPALPNQNTTGDRRSHNRSLGTFDCYFGNKPLVDVKK
ncbi:hypothetical protein [uncultured Paraglaciecola sp.]|uniref:hypothetical protein n=1 Tax=uncultured Paraglaciecola sp. TaxID=1765024 RepID=UPI002639A630|nr:hypothetical protein [uncultured Paraglaciecola sp.]